VELWREEVPGEFLVAFSRRGDAPPGEPSATAHLARRFAVSIGRPELRIARATQVHGSDVLEVSADGRPEPVRLAGAGDVLITSQCRIGLVVQTADCVPLLLSGDGVAAAVHAGWRGSARGAATAAVRALARRYGARPQRLRAFLGPAIGACCYEVGGEVASAFAGEFVRRDCRGSLRLDLKGVNRAQLLAEGIAPESITVLPHCTMCGGRELASYRRDGARAGRMIALVARLDASAGRQEA
jgi:YfiH family protein